jgi:predicted adenylyl cyclase CyaB
MHAARSCHSLEPTLAWQSSGAEVPKWMAREGVARRGPGRLGLGPAGGRQIAKPEGQGRKDPCGPPLIAGVGQANHMIRNIEIKARIASVEVMAVKVATLADHGPNDITQDDTFFVCERGRIKLRVVSPTEGQLIFYQRPNQAGPKESFFVIAPTASPDTLREALSLAYGQAGRVRKHRTLYRVGRTRVHLDRVEHLGDFLELEVELSEDEGVEQGTEEAHNLMASLGIATAQLIAGAYVDLLAQQRA